MTQRSTLDGRVRIRDKRLKDREFSEKVYSLLIGEQGIREVSVNHTAKSMLIIYDRNLISREQILKILEEKLSIVQSQNTLSLARVNKSIAVPGMLLSISISLIGLSIKSKGLHSVAGFIFVSLLLIHLYFHRKQLIPREV